MSRNEVYGAEQCRETLNAVQGKCNNQWNYNQQYNKGNRITDIEQQCGTKTGIR